MNEEMNTITWFDVLADAAAAYHAAETEHNALTERLAAVSDLLAQTRPVYFRAIADAMADGAGVRELARAIFGVCGRSQTSVQRDVARVVVMTCTGWTDAQTMAETPNIGQKNGPSCAAVKNAAESADGKNAARAAVRALYDAAPAPAPAPEPGPDGDGDGDGGADHGTTPGPDPVDIHGDMVAAIVRYITAHDDMDAGHKNLARCIGQAYAVMGVPVPA